MAIQTPFPYREILKPRYWPTWLLLGLLRILILPPYPVQCATGRLIGRAIYQLAPKRRAIAQTNIERCFPELTARQHLDMLKQHFEELGMMVLDTALSWWAPPATLQRLSNITGLEHLQRALEDNRGVILLTGHMTSLDIGGSLLAKALADSDHPMRVMYKRNRNLLLETVIRRGRERFTDQVFIRQDMRSFVRGLRENHPTWYAPDQDFGKWNTVFADFFGIRTATLPTTGRIAAKTGARVVPFFPIRLPEDKGFEIRILPALESFPSGDDVTDATTTNKVLEDIIRQYPTQYLWVHRRFKTRPEGEPAFYSPTS